MHVPTHLDQLSKIAKEVVTARPDLIVTHGTPATLAVLAETRTLPILFFGVADPVGNGIVSNLTRPGGNVTGFTTFESSLAGKWVQLLKELDPQLRRVAILFNPETTPNRSSPFVREFEATAASLQIEPILAYAQDFSGVEPIVAALASEPHGALLVLPDEFNLGYESEIIDVANRHRVPAIYGTRYAAATGGLIAYGPTRRPPSKRLRFTSTASSEGHSLVTSRFKRQQATSLPSIFSPPGDLAYPSHQPSSQQPTRSSSKEQVRSTHRPYVLVP